jgi:hypothetical protein
VRKRKTRAQAGRRRAQVHLVSAGGFTPLKKKTEIGRQAAGFLKATTVTTAARMTRPMRFAPAGVTASERLPALPLLAENPEP